MHAHLNATAHLAAMMKKEEYWTFDQNELTWDHYFDVENYTASILL